MKDRTWDHRWGFRDTEFRIQGQHVTMTGDRYPLSGTVMPEFLPFAEEMLGVKFPLGEPRPERATKPVPAPRNNSAFLKELEATFDSSLFTQEPGVRLRHSHGQTTADELYVVLYREIERVADLVFYCETHDQALKLVELAARYDVCLVPFGGGTSVSCALKLPADEERMIVSVDTTRMNQVEWIDRVNLRASVQAGITGRELEALLACEGFTCGHEPDSIEFSTLGGWIATNASGMKKNRYGNIEDIVENVTVVTPRGVVTHTQDQPRVSMGIQPKQFFFGSEGNLGLITSAVIRIHPKPEVTRYASLVFPTFKAGTDFLFALSRSGVLPASIRLLDNIQFRFGGALKPKASPSKWFKRKLEKLFLTKVMKFHPHELAAATVVMEGSKAEVGQQQKILYKLAWEHGGFPGGEANGKRGYMLTYAIAYIRDFLAQYHILGETYETTVPWTHIHQVIEAVKTTAEKAHRENNLPGRPYVSPRITQIYHTGVCIYFTHGFSHHGVDNPEEVFSKIEHQLRETIMDAGGSISHHHGVGKLRSDFMQRAATPTAIELLKEIKTVHDPKNVFGVRNNVL
ncbi:MAG: FAD-binding oxidoreductase [Vulcanimicrobiota bacterium]